MDDPPNTTGTPPAIPALFMLLNEVGIVNQLATTLLESHLPKGLLVSHFSVVNHLIRVRDGATPLALARAFQVPKTSMTHTLSGLVKHGLVEMRPNPEDARSKQVWLTPQGRAFQQQAIAALGPDMVKMAEALPGLAPSLLPGMTELRKYLDAARDEA